MKYIKNRIAILAILILATSLSLLFACDKDEESQLKKFENITFTDQTVDYDGYEHQINVKGNLPENANVSYTENKGINSGVYKATAVVTCDGYESLSLNATLTINKLNYDTSSVTWNYAEPFTYDATEKSVTIENLPDGVSVKKYINNKAADAGNYTASAQLDYDTVNHNAPAVKNCAWQINKATITGISMADATVEYDGLSHSLQPVGNIPADSITKITYNGEEVDSVTAVGEYTVLFTITNDNYNTFTISAKLNIKSTEEKLYSIVYNNKLYFQNNLDGNTLYSYDGNLTKVNNDKAEYFLVNESTLYYYSSGMFSKVIKSYNGVTASNLIETKGEYLATDGTYIYYAVNNLIKTSDNGIYKMKLDGSDETATRLVKNKAEYLTYYNGKIYYSNASDGDKLYSISVNDKERENGDLIYDEKVSDIILDNGVLYFNSTKTKLGIGVASAIRKYVISSGNCIKLTTDSGKYLTKVGSYIYYVNNDKLTSTLFGDGIYYVSALKDSDSDMSGSKLISAENNGYSSLSSNGNDLYYYKLSDKHIYSYNLSTNEETDIMANFVVKESVVSPTGYAKLTEYNGEIYYVNPLDSGCLYKYNPTTKAKYKVLANSVSNVYFYNGAMYYSTYVLTNYALWKMDLLTNESVKISSSRCDNLIFDGDTIYYVKVGSAYNNHIMKMGLNGENPTEIYGDKNLWVASFEKVNDNIYFTINPTIGKKYVYCYNLTTSEGKSLGLRSNYMTVDGKIMYYYNIEDNTLNSYNLETKVDTVLVSNVNINNMTVSNGYIYYSTKSGNIGLYRYNIANGSNTKISDKCADGMISVNNKIYFIQTAISYTNDYPYNALGDGNLYCYDGKNATKL